MAEGQVKQAKLLEAMKKNPNTLWTWVKVDDTYKCGQIAANNCLYNLFRKGEIQRHIKNDPELGWMRYAYSISEENRITYSPDPNRKGPTGPRTKKTKRKNGQILSVKEFRALITRTIKSLSELEDAVGPTLEAMEEQQKALDKLQNIMNRI